MMALYIPMQPSSKTPRIALSRWRLAASLLASLHGTGRADWNALKGRTWLVSCAQRFAMQPPAETLRKKSSVKSRSTASCNFTPALVSDPLRFSMPTRPGHSPLQLATVRMGPRCVYRPCST